MAASVDIVYRRDKVNSKGESPLYIRITKNRKVQYIATGHKLTENYWDLSRRKVKNNYPNSVRLNNYLNHLKNKYQDEVLKEETTDTKISTKELKRKITGSNDTDFFAVASLVLQKYKEDDKTRTYNKGRSIMQKLKDYLDSEKLPIEEITPTFIGKYESYLKGTLKNKINTINKDLRFIRRVFNEAYRMELVTYDKNPFHKLSLKSEKTKRQFLTEPELNKIEELKLEPGSRMELHRNMFVFSAYSGGLRISDVLLMKWKDFSGAHINLAIQKTGTQLSIKLPNKAIEIITLYKKERNKNDFIFPMLSGELDIKNVQLVNRAISSATAYINKNLKVIAHKAGVEKPVSTHIARHTWATRALRKGISIDKVSKLMGHAQIRETQIYAKIVNEELDNAMDAFNQMS